MSFVDDLKQQAGRQPQADPGARSAASAGARFNLIGPLAVKLILQFDENRQVIKLAGSDESCRTGACQYHLNPEQLEEAMFKQNSTSEQLKKAMSDFIARNSEKLREVMSEQLGERAEKLKNMFGKFKSQIQQKKSWHPVRGLGGFDSPP